MRSVLIAEDDPDSSAIIAQTLNEQLGVSTQVVPNGALVPDALAAYRPGLIVLDLALPGLSGLDVFDVVRSDPVWRGVPILFLTAAPEKASRAFAATGQHRVMGKPFDVDELVAAVASLLGPAETAA